MTTRTQRGGTVVRESHREILIEIGYKKSEADECLYVKFHENGNSTDTSVRVDDGFLTTSSTEEADELINVGRYFQIEGKKR